MLRLVKARSALSISLVALALILASAIAARATYVVYADGPGPRYILAEYTTGMSFVNNYAACQNPGLSLRSDSGRWITFGLEKDISEGSSAFSEVDTGFTAGKIVAGSSMGNFNGIYVNGEYYVDGVYSETFYPYESNPSSGYHTFNIDTETGASAPYYYNDIYVDGIDTSQTAQQGVYAYQSVVDLGSSSVNTSGSTIQSFNIFTSGSACEEMQYYNGGSGGYTSWPGAYTVTSSISNPTNPPGHASATYNSSTNVYTATHE